MAKDLMMTDEEKAAYGSIEAAIIKKDMHQLMGQAVWELWRIANAQEALVRLSNLNLEEQINQVVEDRAKEKAVEMVADKSKRSFIGKK